MSLPTDLDGHSLLAVFAHPDDEAIACGGLLAWCAHLGADVSLLCMTRGEHGQGTAGDVGRTRSRELTAAARALGIGAVTLRDYEDGMLSWLAADDLRLEVERAIRARRPDIVVTFDSDGLYWHPDHIAVHELTTAAVLELGDPAPALYYVTMPRGSMRAVADHAAQEFRSRIETETAWPGQAADPDNALETVGHEPPSSILGVADPDAFGSEAPAPTLVVDSGDFATRKLAALACHASQFRNSALAYVTDRDAPRLLGVEHYRRAATGATTHAFLDALGTRPESLEARTDAPIEAPLPPAAPDPAPSC